MNLQLFNEAHTDTQSKVDFNPLFAEDNSILFLNDRLETARQVQIWQNLKHYFKTSNFNKESCNNLFLIPTSGSTSFTLKLVLLNKSAVLNSAKRVGHFFSFLKNENWLLTIPVFHIGGLSVLARAFCFDQQVFFQPKWHPAHFYQTLIEKNINYTSLVPTQVHDLISLKMRAPTSLKIVFVGGGILTEPQFTQAKELGWPIVKTFGMTETSSMVAYSANKELNYQLFPNCFGKVSSQGFLEIKTDSLFEGYLIEDGSLSSFHFQPANINPENNYWTTEDLAEIKNTLLFVKGRNQDLLKIKGELVNLTEIRNAFLKIVDSKLNPASIAIISQKHDRNENQLILVIDKSLISEFSLEKSTFENILVDFNKTVLPFERIFDFVIVDNIERTELGKIKYASFNTLEFQEYLNENRKAIMEPT